MKSDTLNNNEIINLKRKIEMLIAEQEYVFYSCLNNNNTELSSAAKKVYDFLYEIAMDVDRAIMERLNIN